MLGLSHPFQRRPRRRRRLALVCVCVAALAPVVLGAVAKPLHEDEPGGAGIVEFELAGSVERAEEILATWRAEDVIDDAKAIQLFDLVYPLIYAAALAGACVAASGAWRHAGRPRIAALGVAMAWVAFAAAGFDYIENVGLGVSLWDEPASPWPQLAFAAAVLKFGAIGAALVYSLAGLAAKALPRLD
ncbi:MAG: hypothetical protein ACR2G3_01070 [Solirubrobacterales bacterium]